MKRLLIFTAAISLLALFSIVGCKKDDNDKKLPVLTTNEVSDITHNSAITGGIVTDDGGSTVTARGVCWSIQQNPSINDNKTSDGTGVGSFTSEIKDLEPETTYYVRAYATNANGTGYGSAMSFTTEGENMPVLLVTTNEITEITNNSAISGGYIVDEGGLSAYICGLVWNTSGNPSLNNNSGITNIGSGAGAFTSKLTGLTRNTVYYVRAYASNISDTVYGNKLSFRTTDYYKTLLIESFTGHHCPNCPSGAVVIDNIVGNYENQIIVASIHTFYFGRPTLNFPVDYRIEAGIVIDQWFEMESFGLPACMINRSGYMTGNHRLHPEGLQDKINFLINEDPLIDIVIDLSYESTSRSLNIVISMIVIEEVQEEILLSVFITENGLVSKQRNNNPNIGPTPEIEDYVHKHVLRAFVNDNWGDVISDGNIPLTHGTNITKEYNYTVPQSWNEDHCAIIAYIYSGNTYEILQASITFIR